MKPFSHRALRTFQSGVSLLEVLIAVLVLAFGLLGLAGLQLTSMRSNQSAFERSSAVLLTYNIIDAMNAASQLGHTDAVRTGAFNIGLDDESPGDGTYANSQLTSWRAQIIATLGPDATGSVACVNTADPNPVPCTVTIRWDDSRGVEGSAEQLITTEVQL